MKLKLPSWLRREKVSLPPWASVEESHLSDSGKVSIVIAVDTAAAVEEWLALLSDSPAVEAWVQAEDPKALPRHRPRLDQYWLEVAYQCTKLDVQTAIAGTEYDPRISGKPAQFHFNRADEYALIRHQYGRGIEIATQGKEARNHYVSIRGRMPM